MHALMTHLIATGQHAPKRGAGTDWGSVSQLSGVDVNRLRACRQILQNSFDAIARATPDAVPIPSPPRSSRTSASEQSGRPIARHPDPQVSALSPPRKQRGRPASPIIETPQPLTDDEERSGFADTLAFQMQRHGDSAWSLHRALVAGGAADLNYSTVRFWRSGRREPRLNESMAAIELIERRYRLGDGRLKATLSNRARASTGQALVSVPLSEQRRLAWHLPSDFRLRSPAEQQEILEWVQRVVVSGATDYRRYQAEASRHRFALRFPHDICGFSPPRFRKPTALDASPSLIDEMRSLLAFKTSPPHTHRLSA